MPFRFRTLELAGVVLVEPTVATDARGWFMETYRAEEFTAAGVPARFVQDNHAHSRRGVLRGLHYQQPPKEQGKLIRVASGEIYDVVVDLRPESPTRGRWLGVTLSSENRAILYVPPGFAHGYCVTSEEADVVYKLTEVYLPELEAGLRWNDPSLGIRWPIASPVLSAKDRAWPVLAGAR